MAKKLDARKLREEASEAVNKGKYKKALDRYLKLESVEPTQANWSRRAGDMYRRLNKDDNAVAAFGRAVDRYMKAGFLVKAIAVCKMILALEPEHSETLEQLASLNQLRGIPSRPRGTGPVPALDGAQAPAPEPPPPPPPAPLPAQGIPPVRATNELTVPEPISLPPEPPAPSVPSPPPVPVPRQAAPSDSLDAIEIDSYEELLELAEEPAVVIESLPPEPPEPKRRRTLPPGQPLEAVSLATVIPDARAIAGDDDVTGVSDGVIEIPLDLELEYAFDEIDLSEDSGYSMEALQALSETPLLASLSPDSLHSLITKVELIDLEAGAQLFREGDHGSTLYVVAEGEVAVITEGPPRVTLSTLGENQFFGEIALVTNQPRSATIEATVPTELLAIERDVFSDLVDDEPGVLKLMLRFLRDRLIHRLVHTSPLFGQFAAEERKSLSDKFRFLEVEPGGAIIEQGTESDGLFVVLSGSLEVVRAEDGKDKRLATLGPGDLCGEMSLLSNDDAIATVKATTKSFVLELPAAKFRTVIMTHPQVLMYVGELAEERRRKFESIIEGSADYVEGRLDLV